MSHFWINSTNTLQKLETNIIQDAADMAFENPSIVVQVFLLLCGKTCSEYGYILQVYNQQLNSNCSVVKDDNL